MKSTAVILTAILFAEAWLARQVTGSAAQLALTLGAAAAALPFRFFPMGGRIAAPSLGAVAGVAGWLLFARGWVPVSLSMLPAIWHAAFGAHLWLWLRRLTGDATPPLSTTHRGALLAGGAVVAWTVGTVEIYGASPTIARTVAFAVLGGSLWLTLLADLAPPPGLSTHTPAQDVRAGRTLPVMLALGAAAWLAALLIGPAQWTATKLYAWIGKGDDVTRLDELDGQRPALESGGSGNLGNGRELPRRADIRLNETLRFYLHLDRRDPPAFADLVSRPVHIRTSTLAVFQGDGRLGPLRTNEWRYDSDDGEADGVLRLMEFRDTAADAALPYTVYLEDRDTRAIPLLPRTGRVHLDSLYTYADDWYQLALPDERTRVKFQGFAAPVSLDTLIAAGKAGAIRPGPAPAACLQLPGSALDARIARLTAELAAPGGSTAAQLERLRDGLRARCRYTLRYENPEDREPLDNFLFGERAGHCELFAAATALMLRTLGIPSRVAYGYCGGELDRSRRLLAFRESDFHAWAEVYLDGPGWTIFDTTPGGEGSLRAPVSRPPGRANAFANLDLADYEDLGITVAETDSGTSRVVIALRGALDFLSLHFAAIAGSLGILALGLGLWKRRSRLHRSRGGSGAAPDPSLAAWTVGSGGLAGGKCRPPGFLDL
ncbi:MAG: transglutaminase domain-containing protein, partial [Verrucomicrobiae bacterium]|nr:transglutaminase domain-containing protein [Verrucomicrobiae bacterium]